MKNLLSTSEIEFAALKTELVAQRLVFNKMKGEFDVILDKKPSEPSNWRKNEELLKTLATPLAVERQKYISLQNKVNAHAGNPKNIALAKALQEQLDAKKRAEVIKRLAERPVYKIGDYKRFKDGWYSVVAINGKGDPSWKMIKDTNMLLEIDPTYSLIK